MMILLQKCPDGFYSNAAASSCSQCPAGQKCFDGSNYVTPADCPAGTFSRLGDIECSNCNPGRF